MSSSCSSLGMVKANNGGVEEREPRDETASAQPSRR